MSPLILDTSEESIKYAANSLCKGNIGIFPTDTVYGIGCDASNEDALKNLYNCKKRNLNKPICILVSDIKMIKKYVKSINHIEEQLIRNFFPGALTIIFNKNELLPNMLTSNLETIGIRIPKNNTCISIIKKLKKPLATSSANISSNEPYIQIKDSLIEDFNGKIDFIIDNGKIKESLGSSTIVKVENDTIQILRNGPITKEEIMNKIGGTVNVK